VDKPNPPGKAFGRALHQVARSRSEQYEPAVASVFVDDASQNRKELRHVLNFIQTNDTVCIALEKETRLSDFGYIIGIL